MIPDSVFYSGRSKGVPLAIEVFLRCLMGEVGTLKFVHIFAFWKYLYVFTMVLHGASDVDQRRKFSESKRKTEILGP